VSDYYGPQHWENLYREGRMPWDAGGVPAELANYLARRTNAGRALVPGCGSGYEAVTLAAAGFDVLAIDFSAAAVARAREVTAGSSARVEVSDFFDLADGSFRFVYERAFLCALPPSRRADWARQCAGLMPAGGRLAGYFFLGPTPADGPPFAIPAGELAALLEGSFERLEDSPVEAPLPVFGDAERWQVWQRRAGD
jgi:thiopurine S-methyltransferase